MLKASWEMVRTRLSDLVSSADDDVKQWVTIEIRKVEMKVAAMDATTWCRPVRPVSGGRHFLQMLEAKELHAAKIEVAKLLRSKKLDVEELFKAWRHGGNETKTWPMAPMANNISTSLKII